MQAICRTTDETIALIYADVEPAYQQAVTDLYYLPGELGYAKEYPADTPHMQSICENFRRHGVDMVLQVVGEQPVPWDEALLAFLETVKDQHIDWWLVGSAALAVRGADIVPHDLDLATDAAGAVRLGELLLNHLIEPVLPSGDWIADWFGRAFLSARVEWVGDVHDAVDEMGLTDFGPTARRRSEIVTWRGHPIRVPPVDLQLAVTRQRGLTERVARIVAWLAR